MASSLSSKTLKLIDDLRKQLVAYYSAVCCPHCGALISPDADKCEYCGSTAPRILLERIIRKLEKSLEQIYPIEEVREIIDELNRLAPQIKDQVIRVIRETEEMGRSLLLNQIEKLWSEARENLRSRLLQIEDDVNGLIMTILEQFRSMPRNQMELVRSPNTTNLVTIAEKSEKMWNLIPNLGIPPEIIGQFQVPSAMRHVADFLYRGRRFEEAIKWYSRALTSIMYPPSEPVKPGAIPRYSIAEYIPFGAFYLGAYDVDKDNIKEIIYVPSRELGGLRLPSLLLTKGGVIWPRFVREGIVNPLLGKFDDHDYLLAVWPESSWLDAKILSPNNNQITIKTKNETTNIISSYGFIVADYDGDGKKEIVSLAHRPPGVGFYRFIEDYLVEEGKIMTGQIYDGIAADVNGDGHEEIIVVNKSGDLIIVDGFDMKFERISEKISYPESIMFCKARLSNGSEDVFFSTHDGVFHLGYEDESYSVIKLTDESPVSISSVTIGSKGYLVLINRKIDGIFAELYTINEILGVKALSKVAEIPMGLHEIPKLERAKYDSSWNIGFSKNISIASDVDRDDAEELFIGLNGVTLAIDFRF